MSDPPALSNRLLLWSAAVVGGAGMLLLIFLLRPAEETNEKTGKSAEAVALRDSPKLKETPEALAVPSAGTTVASKAKPASGADTAVARKPVNFHEAGRELLASPEQEDRGEAIARLLTEWAAVSPQEAAGWVAGLPAGTLKQDACSDLLSAWGALNPAAAAAWLTAAGLASPETAGTLAGVWAGSDPEKAIAWAETLPEKGGARLAAQASIAGAWAEKEPVLAAAWVLTLPEQGRNIAAIQVVLSWADRDGAAAAAWIAAAFAGKPQAMEAPAAVLAMAWSQKSPAGVSRWLNTLPPGQVKEAAVTAFAVSAAAQAPASALSWAMSLGGAEQRNETVADVCERWFDGAPESFRSGIAGALDAMEDPVMRKGIYAMLYERDPGFRDQLLALVEEPVPGPPPSPSAEAGENKAPDAVPAANDVLEDDPFTGAAE